MEMMWCQLHRSLMATMLKLMQVLASLLHLLTVLWLIDLLQFGLLFLAFMLLAMAGRVLLLPPLLM